MRDHSRLVVFGDSLSDCGRTMQGVDLDPQRTGGVYYKYRYSDGPIYVDYLSEKLGLQPADIHNVYARGSATTDSVWCQGISDLTGVAVPGVAQQIMDYLKQNGGADSKACHILWAGTNDYYFNLHAGRMPCAATIIENIAVGVATLQKAGAECIMVGHLIGLDMFPGFQRMCPGQLDELAAATIQFNAEISRRLAKLGCVLYVFDVNSELKEYEQQHGPGSLFIWDQWHLTTGAHGVVADVIVRALNQ